ncbi:hypothetical protein CP532_6661 [Ophiocordyceps camponoti-leonardi (nom. inval.)]|nr:hypothetical protein CP532_6661 [Ophiocordyceps camponoti-leonardi (nom. inval.)]
MSPAVTPGHVRVFVGWCDQTVFAGEEVKCTITFKNVASESDNQKQSPSPPPPTQHSQQQSQQQQQQQQQPNSPSCTRGHGPTSPRSVRGHRRSALSLSGPPSNSLGRPGSMQWPQTATGGDWSRGHAHKRSLSIVSIGSAAGADDHSSLHDVGAKPQRGHGRAASLQILPRGPTSHTAFPVVNNSSCLPDRFGRMTAPNTPSGPGPRRSPLGSPSPLSDFRFPAEASSSAEAAEGSTSNSAPGTHGSPTGLHDQGAPIRSRDFAQPPPDRSTARVLSSSSAPGGTPRSSGEFYSLSNNSSETLASEYVHHKLMRGHGRQRGPSRRSMGITPSQARAPESLMMGYAQIQGSFSLDGSLISLGPFEHVKKAAVGGRGGGVVGLEPSKRESGLLRSFGWANISSSLGDLLGSGELSSIKEMRGAANSKSVPLLSTPQSILFVDLQLAPGESRAFEYSFKLPKGLPPTHKGKAVKFSYSLVIGTQRAGGAKEHQVRSVEVPFRVLGSVNSQGELLGHDLMNPYVLLRDEAEVRSLGKGGSKSRVQRPATEGPAAKADFVSYVDGLLARRKDGQGGTLQSPTETVASRRPSALEETTRAKEAIDLAIMRSNVTGEGQQSPNRFEISRNGRRVGVVMLTRPAYRLGEVINMAIDFGDADVACYAVHVTLETSERVDASLAVRSESSIQRVTRKVYVAASEATLFARRVTFSPTIPVSATPEFVTSGISLEWKMRLEFVVPYQGGETAAAASSEMQMAHPLLEPVSHDNKGGLVLVAVEKVACESFDVSVPLRVYGAVGSGLERLERDEASEEGLPLRNNCVVVVVVVVARPPSINGQKMASSNNRLKLTPSNSPFPPRTAKTPLRGRTPQESTKLSLKRVVGTTCRSPTGFDSVNSLFAYKAGGAVVVVDVRANKYSQRFFRARPSAVPLQPCSPATTATPKTTTPKANDSRNRVAPSFRDIDVADSPASRTWTRRERIKAVTCLALSRDAKYLAVGETGYAPRVLIFSLTDASSDTPLVSISEHAFGVAAVAWSADSKYLASLGAANDGFLCIWKIDPRTGAAKLFQQNKCISNVRSMVWRGHSLVTLGVRHVKVWKVDGASAVPQAAQRPLAGRNVVLGDLLETTFSCAAVDGERLIMCTDTGDVCVLEEGDERQTKLIKVLTLNFPITAINISGDVAYIGGRDGYFATLDVPAVMRRSSSCVLTVAEAPAGIVALGCLDQMLVTVDSRQSIDLWTANQTPGQKADAVFRIPIPGHGEPVAGVQALRRPNSAGAAFVTWSYSGNFTYWGLGGQIKSTVEVAVDAVELDGHVEFVNQLTCARTTSNGQLLVTADRLGILKVTDARSGECLLDIKAHSSDCKSICIFDGDGAAGGDDDDKFIMACCGRDRTAQLFHRRANGSIEHFQTLEFAAKVVQVLVPSDDKVITCSLDRTVQIHDLVCKDGDPDVMAALPSRVISLRASPTSMAMSQDGRSIFVSLLDRSVFQFDLATGRQLCCFKCTDEGGVESTVLESLTVGSWGPQEAEFLLGSSNTDKSVRIYDAHSGSFLDREWGHTESINGVCLVEDDDGSKKVVSVGSDGTMMVWSLDVNDRSCSRDPSPAKDSPVGRPTLRRVLSKADLADFQRPSGGRQSPPRALQHRTSRLGLAASSRISSSALQASPCPGGTSSGPDNASRRRPSSSAQPDSPPPSPKTRNCRTQSLSVGSKGVRKKSSSSSSLNGFGSLNMATEQACRTMRAYRKKLSSTEPITADGLTELDHELRLTIAALGDRAIRTQAINETVLSGLLDQYSERLVTLLDEKLRLTSVSSHSKEREDESLDDEHQEIVAPIHLAKRKGPLGRWRGGPWGMSGAAVYTPLESLFLFQSLLGQGIDSGAFVRISEILRNNAIIKSGETYDPSRLTPDALQQLFLRLLREELKCEGQEASSSPSSSPGGSRKRKLGSPPLPSLRDASQHIEKLPALIDRLYARYRDSIVEQIREDERQFAAVQGQIQALEKTEKERLAKAAASQHGTPVLAPRDGGRPSHPPSHQSPVPIPGPLGGIKRPSSVLNTPVPTAQPAVVPPSHAPPGTPLARPPSTATGKPLNGSSSVLQPPAGLLPQAASRVLQPPAPPPKPVISPRPESASKPQDGAGGSPAMATTTTTTTTATPAGGILKWEKPYQPPQAGQPPPLATPLQQSASSPHSALQKPQPPQQRQQQQHQQQQQQQQQQQTGQLPRPAAPGMASRPTTSKTAIAPPVPPHPSQSPGPLAAPMQPGPSRPPTGPSPTQSTTPVIPPVRGFAPPTQAQNTTPRPLTSASPQPPPPPLPPPKVTAAASQKRNPAAAQPAQRASVLAAPNNKPQATQYAAQAPRPAVPEHIIRQAATAAAATAPAAVRVSPITAPRTPLAVAPVPLTRGFGTKWAPQSTPSTPGPQTAEQESPAYEPVSPPRRAVSTVSDTPKTTRKTRPKPATHQPEPPTTRPRGRPPRKAPTSSISSAGGNRRSQSVASQADELSMDHPILPATIKKEAQTPRTHDDAGDTTADESAYGRTHMTTPGSVSSRMAKRKRQETPSEPPNPPTQVLWTRGFTKVSSSALDQISSHRYANMFATGVRERDAPNYRQIVLQPQDITSIRAAIKLGNKAATQAAASLPGGDPGTASVWLPVSEDLVPPRGIINSAQLERELVHIFCNAIMYNPDPDRGPGAALMKRSRGNGGGGGDDEDDEEEAEEAFGYHVDENGVVKNTRSMFVEVEKLLGDLRSAEKERGVPPLSSSSGGGARQASVATPADDTAEDEDELAGEGVTSTSTPSAAAVPTGGVVKRRRVGGRGMN